MYYREHGPPHFHARYGEHAALIAINNLTIIEGRLPPRAHGLVIEWASRYQEELWVAWNRAQAAEPPGKIVPLG
jgi:hypothetical protein